MHSRLFGFCLSLYIYNYREREREIIVLTSSPPHHTQVKYYRSEKPACSGTNRTPLSVCVILLFISFVVACTSSTTNISLTFITVHLQTRERRRYLSGRLETHTPTGRMEPPYFSWCVLLLKAVLLLLFRRLLYCITLILTHSGTYFSSQNLSLNGSFWSSSTPWLERETRGRFGNVTADKCSKTQTSNPM